MTPSKPSGGLDVSCALDWLGDEMTIASIGNHQRGRHGCTLTDEEIEAAIGAELDRRKRVPDDSTPRREPEAADTGVASLREWLTSWGDGPNWSDATGRTVPIAKSSLLSLLDANAQLVGERDAALAGKAEAERERGNAQRWLALTEKAHCKALDALADARAAIAASERGTATAMRAFNQAIADLDEANVALAVATSDKGGET